MNEAEKIEKILRAIRGALLPLTERMVEEGNHVFGGLVLRAEDCSVVAAGSNDRVENPIYHGEIDTLRRYFALAERARAAWLHIRSEPRALPDVRLGPSRGRGFREVWMLYGYEAVKDGFDMPVDLMMYREIFGAEGPAHGKRILHAALPARRGGDIPRTPSARCAADRNRRRLLRDAREEFRVSGNVAGRRSLNQFLSFPPQGRAECSSRLRPLRSYVLKKRSARDGARSEM